MFSFGQEPQLPIEEQSVDSILKALKNNIRLQCPALCPSHVYTNIMLECWKLKAAERPTFHGLTKMFEDILQPDKSVIM